MNTVYSSETLVISAIALMTLVNFSEIPTPPTGVNASLNYSGSEMAVIGLPFLSPDTPQLTEEDQKAILAKFVSKLVENAKEPPQEAIDILNKHFWDLI